MISLLASAAVLGASLFPSAVVAAPAGLLNGSVSAPPTSTFSSLSSTATPFALADGFPSPNQAQLQAIQTLARGSLSNGARPAKISDDGATSLQLIQFNENFEVAFFSSLVNNITGNVPGYEVYDKATRDYLLNVLTAVVAQEELHALNAGNALKAFNKTVIQTCRYTFPTSNLADAISLAATFTDVVLGTLQDVVQIFAANTDAGLARGTSSVIGQEGEQAGFFRLMQNNPKIPNALPFLTTSTRDFAFSALQNFVVPGSCPNVNAIPLKIFGPLTIVSTPAAKDMTLDFKVDLAKLPNIPLAKTFASSGNQTSGLFITYINQQNLPVSTPLMNARTAAGVISFSANFPFTANQFNGLTIAALTVGQGFANAPAVANATLFGPGFIELN